MTSPRPVDSVDVCAATSTADNDKRRVHKRNRDWLTRLHLRKAALPPAAMQTPDEPGPKTRPTAAAEKHAWASAKKLRGGRVTETQRALGNGGDAHFDEQRGGRPPVFSCHACKFTTHEFSYLQVHVLSHKDTFSCCSLCRDDVQRTWAEFSAHLAKVHARNGKYLCDACKKFSTSDDKEFLEHILLHSLGLDMKNEQTIRKTSHSCPCCDYETSQRNALMKHMETVHKSANCNRKSKDVFPTNETKAKARATRSAVKDISWLTQDCLALPGREFLDKYCHLSDAQTTLEETQQFLMKSGKQKWSKALKDALSYVPHEVNLQSRTENGAVAPVLPDSSQDVLTLNNKLNQNGASFAKRLKPMAEKEVGNSNKSKIASDASSSDRLRRREAKLSSDAVKAESTDGRQTEENRENQRVKTGLNGRDGDEAAVQEDAITNEQKAKKTTMRRRKTTVRKAAARKKRNKNWRNLTKRCKNAGKLKTALALRIVLKKSPKKGKQWVTQSAASSAKCNSTTDALKLCNGDGGKADGTVEDEREAGGGGTGKQTGGIRVSASGTTATSPAKSEVGEGLRGPDGLEAPRGVLEEASPLVESVITPQSETSRPPTGSSLSFCSGPSPSPPASAPWTPTPKSLERTLHLVAVSPAQPVKRPAGEQPVVVLNHPDVDAPEVSRVMAVVNRYKGEVHKVVLSKRTLNALGDAASSRPGGDDDDALGNGVRERFLLKLKLRRLSKRKFEVVGGETSSLGAGDEKTPFRCWFCGRAFGSRRAWVIHRQRHLMEWKSPKCESS